MKIILSYSGGLDTSVLVHWYANSQNAEVITYCADVGQEEELDGLEEKALATGATAHRTLDLVDEFAEDFIYPMVRGNAVYESQYLLGTSIARPLIAKAQIEIAREFGATALAHGATGKGNDQCRFELTFSALAPDLKILAPWRDASFRKIFPGRQQMIEYCKEHGIDVEASASKPYSMDRNLWHISYEAGILEDPWFDPSTPENREMYKLTIDPELAPDEPQYLELEFIQGNCISIDGQSGKPSEIVWKLNEIAGKHGIGRVDLVENRFVGMKSRGVYETPGGTILLNAHRQLETLTMDRDLMHLRDSLIPRYAELIYYGFWYAPERDALQALIDESQKNVSGTVRLKLYKGNITTVGRKSDHSLYDLEIASMDDDESDYRPEDAGGFIRLHALRLKERARKQGYKV